MHLLQIQAAEAMVVLEANLQLQVKQAVQVFVELIIGHRR
jgi:hypothetical protein